MTKKATRRLTDIKFDHEGASVALVGVHQGGPANGVLTLITKALDVTDEAVQQAQQAALEKAMSSASNDGDLLNESTTEEGDMDKIDKAEHEVLVAKAVEAATEVLKAQMAAKDEALEVAKATIKNFEDAQAAAKTAARVEALKAAGKGDERAVELEKSLASLDDEAFAEIVKDFAAATAIAGQSELMVEKGVDGQGAPKSAADATLRLLQEKYAAK